MNSPRTMNARRARIREILASQVVSSQADLGDLLASEGIVTTQATLSRDLDGIGAVKQAVEGGDVRYVVPSDAVPRIEPGVDAVARVVGDVLLSAEPAMNIAVLRTPPGAAMYLAGALDRSGAHGIVGTVAGDDTVMVVLRTTSEAEDLCRHLLRLADRRAAGFGREETRKTS